MALSNHRVHPAWRQISKINRPLLTVLVATLVNFAFLQHGQTSVSTPMSCRILLISSLAGPIIFFILSTLVDGVNRAFQIMQG